MPVLEPRFKVLRYDLRGHGGTRATPGEYTIDMLVQDLVGLLDSQKIQRTSLVGLGLGGAIAQAFAIRHPGRVDRLMPCCCRAQMVPDFAAMWHKLRDTVRQNGLESIVEQTVQRWFSEDFKAAHPEVLEKVRAMIRRTTFEGYMGVTAAFLGLGGGSAAAPDRGAHPLCERRRRQAGRAAGADGRARRESAGRAPRLGAERRAYR